MNLSMNRILSLAGLVGLATAALSNATTPAKFHLPVTAHWGRDTLAPGDYEIWMAKNIAGVNQFEITSGDHHMRALPITTDAGTQDSGSSLKLVERNGSFFVREYRSKELGKTFVFGLPKSSAARD